MRLLLTLISILILFSCSKRTVDLAAISSSQSSRIRTDSTANAKITTRDNSNKIAITAQQYGYRLTIVPDGEFTFDKNGFKGKAKQITAEGAGTINQFVRAKTAQEANIETNVKVKTDNGIKKSEHIKNKTVQATGFNWTLIITIFLSSIIIIIAIKYGHYRITKSKIRRSI